jgi:hypothetical protein
MATLFRHTKNAKPRLWSCGLELLAQSSDGLCHGKDFFYLFQSNPVLLLAFCSIPLVSFKLKAFLRKQPLNQPLNKAKLSQQN